MANNIVSLDDMYGGGAVTTPSSTAPNTTKPVGAGRAKTVSLDDFYTAGQPSDTQQALASIKSIGSKEFEENNLFMQMGAALYKHLTGQQVEGTLTQDTPEMKALKVRLGMEQPEVPWYKTPVKLAERFMDNPKTTLVELGKGILYDPELLTVGAIKSPALVSRLVKGAAVGGGIGAAQSLAQQSVQKDTVSGEEIAGSAFAGASQGALLAGVLGGKGGGEVNKIPADIANMKTDSQGRPWQTSVENPEAIPPEPTPGTLFGQDARWNAEKSAYDLMQRGASKAEVEAVRKRNPLVGTALDEMMARRQDVRQGPMSHIEQGEVFDPEDVRNQTAAEHPDPYDFTQTINRLVDQRVQQVSIPRLGKGQGGAMDPELMRRLGIAAGVGATGAYAYSNPERAKQVAEAAGLIGMALTTKGELPPEVTKLTAKIPEASNSDIALQKLTALQHAAELEELPQNVTQLITKPLQEFHKSLGQQVQERIAQTQQKVDAYPDWKFQIGDRVQSPKTGGVYKITGKTWNPQKDTPQYFYESTLPQNTEGWSKGTFEAEKAHETLVKFTGPQRLGSKEIGSADPKTLLAITGLSIGALTGAYLDPDHPIAGALLGSLAGVALSRVRPSTMGDLAKRGMSFVKNPEQFYDKRIRVTDLGDAHETYVESARLVNAKFNEDLKKLVPDPKVLERVTDEIERPEIVKALQAAKVTGQKAKADFLTDYLKKMDSTPLTPEAQKAMGQVKEFFSSMKQAGLDAETLHSARDNYVTHIWEWGDQSASRIQQLLNRSELGGGGMRGTTPYAKLRTIGTIAEGKFLGLSPRTQNVADIVEAYGNSMAQAIANKQLITGLKASKTPGGSHLILSSDKAPHTYVRVNHPQFEGMKVHPDIAPSVRFLFDQKDPGGHAAAALALTTALKRVDVSFSLFHVKNLFDASIGASSNPWKAFTNMKGYVNGKDALLQELNGQGLTPFIKKAIGAGLKISLERGASTEEELGGAFYSFMRDTQKFLDDSIPGAGIPVDKLIELNHRVDTLTWGRVHTGMKLNIFAEKMESILTNNAKAHAANPDKVALMSEMNAAKIAASFTNDIFGGLNWRRVAEATKTRAARDFALWVLKPSNRRLSQFLLFAPDWTLSTVRAITGALGKGSGIRGLTNARTLADLHRQYIARSAFYYFTVGNLINYAMSGHYIWDNKDKTRLDMGDGRTMQWSKHTMETVEWATKPGQQMLNKLNFPVKEPLEQAFHTEYLSASGRQVPMKESRTVHLLHGVLPITAQATSPGRAIASALGTPIYGMTPQEKIADQYRRRMQKLQEGK